MRIDAKRTTALMNLQKRIDYQFKNINILNNALTHSSSIASKDDYSDHNERMEFIGDSILSMIISLYLYEKCKNLPEGHLTRIRANIVCEQSLHNAAGNIELGKYLLLSKGEEHTGGRKRASTLADAFEALIAAVFLDGGLKNARNFVLKYLEETIHASIQNKVFSDYKSYLQEYIQKNNSGKLNYEMLAEEGPDHDKTFEMALYLDDKLIGRGTGHSKKDAQQASAKAALESMGIMHE